MIIIFLSYTSFNCNAAKQVKINSRQVISPSEELSRTVDSLSRNDVDTILYYIKGCYGCIGNISEAAYIFWVNEGKTQLKKFDASGIYKSVDVTGDIFKYYFTNENLINEEETTIQAELLHNHYLKIKVLSGSSLYETELPDIFYEDVEEEYHVVEWVYRIESILFNIERNNLFIRQ